MIHALVSTAYQTLFSLPYVYKPLLVPDSIRVLQLQPASFDAPLSGSFCSVVLDAHPPPVYMALSYTWGDPKSTAMVKRDTGFLGIGSNLEAALRHIRSPDQPVRLWVDALCINQCDIPKKNSQVKNMGRVYKNAQEVLLWLGLEITEEPEMGTFPGCLAFHAATELVNEPILCIN